MTDVESDWCAAVEAVLTGADDFEPGRPNVCTLDPGDDTDTDILDTDDTDDTDGRASTACNGRLLPGNLITEMMEDPTRSSGAAHYFEVYNTTDRDIELGSSDRPRQSSRQLHGDGLRYPGVWRVRVVCPSRLRSATTTCW